MVSGSDETEPVSGLIVLCTPTNVLHFERALHRNPPSEVKKSLDLLAMKSLLVRAARLRPLLLISSRVECFSLLRLSIDMSQDLNTLRRLSAGGMGLFVCT